MLRYWLEHKTFWECVQRDPVDPEVYLSTPIFSIIFAVQTSPACLQ